MAGWEQVEEGTWFLPSEADGQFCHEVKATFGWRLESRPGKGLTLGGTHGTLAACVAESRGVDVGSLRGTLREEALEALSRAAGAGEPEAVAPGEWALPLAEGEQYPRITYVAHYYPTYGMKQSAAGGWQRSLPGYPVSAPTLDAAMDACEQWRAENPGSGEYDR